MLEYHQSPRCEGPLLFQVSIFIDKVFGPDRVKWIECSRRIGLILPTKHLQSSRIEGGLVLILMPQVFGSSFIRKFNAPNRMVVNTLRTDPHCL